MSECLPKVEHGPSLDYFFSFSEICHTLELFDPLCTPEHDFGLQPYEKHELENAYTRLSSQLLNHKEIPYLLAHETHGLLPDHRCMMAIINSHEEKILYEEDKRFYLFTGLNFSISDLKNKDIYNKLHGSTSQYEPMIRNFQFLSENMFQERNLHSNGYHPPTLGQAVGNLR